MKYELAKELKDAGFPQAESGPMYWCTDGGERTYSKICKPYSKATCGDHERIKFPTLSELIKACGDRFWRLEMFISALDNSYTFIATAHPVEGASGKGASPEKAVAKLCLAIQPK